MPAAVRDLQCLAETDAQDLSFLLCLLETSEQQRLAQVCTALPRAPLPLPSPSTQCSGQLCTPSVLISPGVERVGVHTGGTQLASSSPDNPSDLPASLHEVYKPRLTWVAEREGTTSSEPGQARGTFAGKKPSQPQVRPGEARPSP